MIDRLVHGSNSHNASCPILAKEMKMEGTWKDTCIMRWRKQVFIRALYQKSFKSPRISQTYKFLRRIVNLSLWVISRQHLSTFKHFGATFFLAVQKHNVRRTVVERSHLLRKRGTTTASGKPSKTIIPWTPSPHSRLNFNDTIRFLRFNGPLVV